VLSNDWVVQYEARHFQVVRQSGQAPAKSTVLVRETEGGAIDIRYRGRRLQWAERAGPPAKPIPPPRPAVPPARTTWRPSADHPWRRDTRPAERELAWGRAANR
jgi:hypothetical protein